MNPNIADLITDELRATRKKLNLITELLRSYVTDESQPIYRLIFDASVAVETVEAEVLKLKGDSGGLRKLI